MRKLALIASAVILVALLAWRTSEALRNRQAGTGGPAGQRPGALVQTATVQRATLELRATHVGEVAAESSVDVAPKVSGTVSEILVEEGDTVRRGQVIARVGAQDLQFDVAQAQASYHAQRVQVDAARAALATQRARLAQVMAGAPAEQLRQAEEQVRQAQVSLEFSRQQLHRQEELFSQGYVSRQQVDAARLEVSVQEARLRTAEEQLTLLRREPRPEAVQVARAQVDEAEVGDRQAQSRLEQARVTLREAERVLAQSAVIAPVAGVIGRRLAETGQTVTPATPLIRLIDVDPAIITVPIIERDLRLIRVGMPVMVRTDALPGQTFTGRLTAISPMLATATRTADVRIEVPNSNRALQPGMFAGVDILLARREQVVAVPVDAVLERDAQQIVFVIREQTAHAQPVEAGISDGTMVEIRRGLAAGEVIAVAGHRNLRDGMPVITPTPGAPTRQPGGSPPRAPGGSRRP